MLLTGTGFYKGSTTTTFTIRPKKEKIKKLSKAKKAFTVKWTKQTNIDGYQIQYSTNKKFKKGNKTKTVKDAKKVSLKVKKLKSKKTYYVRVRSYKIVSGKKIYSAWSASKKVKTK